MYGSIGGGGASRAGYEVREAKPDAPEAGGSLAMAAEEGSLDAEDAEDAIRPHWRRLTRCYDQAGEARDFASGPVTLRFVVGTDGRTVEVHVLASSLGSFDVERCLVSTARGIVFRRPHGGARASVEYSLEFRATGEVPVLELEPDAVTSTLPALIGRLARDCQQLGVDEVNATIYVDRKGAVRSAGFASRKPFPETNADCVARTMRTTLLPAGVQGAAVGRTVIALRDSDLRNPPALARAKKKPARPFKQGRRAPGRR